MKDTYIALMEKTLSAYTDQHILDYFDKVKSEGLTEHGFPRLTSDIGILISHGIRTDLLPLFREMMQFCCESIPQVKAANDFSVKEIVFCLMEIEKSGVVEAETIDSWKKLLATIEPCSCYTVYAKTPEDRVFNWACFTLVSEYMRQYIGLCDSREFIDIQIPTQLHWIEENGMYRDALIHPPMVYDLVVRGLFSILLHFGYRGKFYEEIDAALKKSGIHTLKMQSVTGEIPFGGRSHQFMHNEANLAIIFEYEARRYAAIGDTKLAGEFKRAADNALSNIAQWLDQTPIYHIKNRFPTETKYGCEKYAYFDKYMITTASFLYVAYMICDDSIVPSESADHTPTVFRTSDYFHKVFLKSGGYALEFDIDADPHYDASGLGRIHREGAPSTICLSAPCPSNPKYVINASDAAKLALCPGVKVDGEWLFASDNDTKYHVTELFNDNVSAYTTVNCCFPNGQKVMTHYSVNENGVEISVKGEGDIAYSLPAFYFDGERYPEIVHNDTSLSVFYKGWECRYTTDGEITDSGMVACNRNGNYRVFFAKSETSLKINVQILKNS